jgi:hypothetical protein
MKKFVAIWLLFSTQIAVAQRDVRYFLEIPGLFAHTPDVENVKDIAGLKGEIGFAVASHFLTARTAFQYVSTIIPTADNVEKTFVHQPISRLEIGIGPYRTNGQRCTRSHQNAFTLQGRAAILYNFEAKKPDYGFGLELSHFYIRDYFRNTELLLRSEYQLKSQKISVDFGFRFFLNLLAPR